MDGPKKSNNFDQNALKRPIRRIRNMNMFGLIKQQKKVETNLQS